jgi:hypothetical protein
MMHGTVTIAVSSNGFGCEMELSPAEAREFAATVIELADLAEAEAEAVSETTTPITDQKGKS